MMKNIEQQLEMYKQELINRKKQMASRENESDETEKKDQII